MMWLKLMMCPILWLIMSKPLGTWLVRLLYVSMICWWHVKMSWKLIVWRLSWVQNLKCNGHLTQKQYLTKVLQRFGMDSKTKHVSSALVPHFKLSALYSLALMKNMSTGSCPICKFGWQPYLYNDMYSAHHFTCCLYG